MQTLAAVLNKHLGLPYGKTAAVLELGWGLQMRRGVCARLWHDWQRSPNRTSRALVERTRVGPSVTLDETGWKVGGRLCWMWTSLAHVREISEFLHGLYDDIRRMPVADEQPARQASDFGVQASCSTVNPPLASNIRHFALFDAADFDDCVEQTPAVLVRELRRGQRSGWTSRQLLAPLLEGYTGITSLRSEREPAIGRHDVMGRLHSLSGAGDARGQPVGE